jgi:hypothetical protein
MPAACAFVSDAGGIDLTHPLIACHVNLSVDERMFTGRAYVITHRLSPAHGAPGVQQVVCALQERIDATGVTSHPRIDMHITQPYPSASACAPECA